MISDINARLDVRCADHEAARHVAEFIDEHLVDVGVVGLTLRLSKKTLERSREQLDSRVCVTLTSLCSAGDLQQTYSLDLAPNDKRGLPFLSGALAVHTSIADDSVGIVLAGRYTPIGSNIARPADLSLGHRIAQASATALVHTIGRYVEVASARSEAARAGRIRHLALKGVMQSSP